MPNPNLLQHAETSVGAWWVNGGTSDVLAFASPTAAQSLLVLFVKTMSNIALSSVTDTQGNTWTLGTKIVTSGGTSIQAAWALSTVGGSTPTVTANFASAVAQAVASIAEFSNIQNVRTVSFFNTVESVIGTGLSASSSIQANVPGDLVLSICDSGTVNTHLQIAGPVDTAQQMPWNAIPVQAFVDTSSFAWAWGIGVQLNGKSVGTWTLTNSANWSAVLFSFAPPVPAQISPTTNADPFSGANQAPLAGNWSTWGSAAALNLTSNLIVPSSTSLICGAYWNANAFGDNHYSEVVVGAVGSSSQTSGPAVRMSSNGSQTNGYCGAIFSSTVMQIFKIVNGVRTGVGTSKVVSAIVPGDVIRMSACGNMLCLTKNGTVISSVFDPTFPTGGAPGMMIFQNSQASSFKFSSWNGGQFGDTRFYQNTVFGDDGAASSYSGAFTAPNKAGSLLVACVGFPDLSDPGSSISDTQGNVWNKIAGVINGPTFGQTFFYCLSAKPGPNIVTGSRAGGGHLPVTVAEYVNPNGLGWTFDSSTKNSANASTQVSATLTTAQANEILVAYVGIQLNGTLGLTGNSIYRPSWTGEIKLLDQPAPSAGSNTFTAILTDGNGTPTTLNQEILLVAFAPITPAGADGFGSNFRFRF
jgi:hypothetical protein